MSASLSAERRIFWLAAAFCGVTRFAALARSPWDWDEALFLLGMREYDVTSHHPHPPGFPVYIAMAKLVRLIVGSDFRALQSLNVLASILVFPALYLYARAIGLRFSTSIVAGVLFACLPNVWFFGGTAFSDVPSIVIVLFAVVLLLRGEDSRRNYFLGTVLLALSAGIRPQNLLVGLFPGVLASRKRPLGDVMVALFIGVTICGVAFGAAALATGDLDSYLRVIREHGDYISRVDSFRNPDRPPLWRIFDRFFLRQYQSASLSIVTSLFVLVSVAGAIRNRDRTMLRNLLTFGPVAVAAWMMLDRFSISRFSIGYAPMFAVFAADGIRRVSASRPRYEWMIGGALAGAFIVWTLPALTDVRQQVSPNVRAVEAAAREISRDETLFVEYSMVPFVEYFAPQIPFVRVDTQHAMPLSAGSRLWLLAEGEGAGMMFTRGRGRLWKIARRHYFEVVLMPLRNTARFGTGWYEAARDGMNESRWMGAHSETVLPPVDGPAELGLDIHVPQPLIGSTVTVFLNGSVIDRFRADDSRIARNYEGLPGSSQNILELSISRTIVESDQPLGLRLHSLSWRSRASG